MRVVLGGEGGNRLLDHLAPLRPPHQHHTIDQRRLRLAALRFHVAVLGDRARAAAWNCWRNVKR
eukprot:scaffold18270_cov33-Tisochrysis_lutea.AAC.1